MSRAYVNWKLGNMMKLQNRYPLVKLPVKVQVALFLIKEELKSRKLFGALQQLGLDDSHFQPHLDSLILTSLGMDEECDDTFNIYCEIMERRSQKIEADHDTIMKQALKVYQELMNAKKNLSMKSKP